MYTHLHQGPVVDAEKGLCFAEAEKRGVGPRAVGMIFSIYAFVNFCVSPYMGKALQRR